LEELQTPEEALLSTTAAARPLRLDICTDFGPPDDDKPCNQDAAAYAFLKAPVRGLAVALADGVSNSPYSEYGARIAAQASVSFVEQRLERIDPGDPSLPALFQALFDEAVDEMRRRLFLLWWNVAQRPGDFLAPGWRPSVFARAVEEKELFLTTLIIAVVLEREPGTYHGYYGHVGDGGLSFYRNTGDGPETVDALACGDETILDSFIGPDVERRCFPRCFHSRLGAEFAVCLATDGIARAIPLAELLALWREQAGQSPDNVARSQIERLKAEMPTEVADNLSLAFLGRLL